MKVGEGDSAFNIELCEKFGLLPLVSTVAAIRFTIGRPGIALEYVAHRGTCGPATENHSDVSREIQVRRQKA
jgi:hypothetical protein